MTLKTKVYMSYLFQLAKRINNESNLEYKQELIKEREYLHSLITEDKAELVIMATRKSLE